MASAAWKPFPHPDPAYRHAGAALKKNWARLHRGDREPYPDVAGLEALVAANPKLGGADLKQAAQALQEAWRAFHAGDFQQAAEQGNALGPLGFTVANKATAIYANYVETDEARKLALFQEVAKRAEAQQAAAPRWANAFHFHAYALGRYSQSISIAAALAQGLAGKVRASLEKTLQLEPDHADAHIALAMYHAEIIDKVGALVGGVTYGAKKEAALEHFRRALELMPDSAIARIEYANGLVMMYGKGKLAEASRLYEEAAQGPALDAMERLDVELARAELAE